MKAIYLGIHLGRLVKYFRVTLFNFGKFLLIIIVIVKSKCTQASEKDIN